MAKHGRNNDTRKIVNISDYQPDYGEEEVGYEYKEEEAEQEEQRKRKIPKAVYRITAVLLVAIIGLAIWVNRDNLSFENIKNWVVLQVVGSGEGDGFPVPITGSQVFASNFTTANSNAMILSDTALTILNDTGKELVSLRHDLNNPVMKSGYGKTLLYNSGSTGYLVISGAETKVTGTAKREILAGAITQNGRFAIGMQGEHGASELNVFMEDGSLQYKYTFAKDYITAIALNYDGTCGAVCTVRSEGGELISKITVFDFNKEDPLSSYETANNYLMDAYWAENGELYAIGDMSLLRASSAGYDFTDYFYEGRQITAYTVGQGRVFLSLSAYEHAGPCTLLIFNGRKDPVRVEFGERIIALSSYGGTVAALSGGKAVFSDWSTGSELGRDDIGSDAKSLALYSERAGYVLGVSEIRMIDMK